MTPHILVVDDDLLLSEVVGLLLRNAGYRVSAARHFMSALDILDQSPPPDLLLTDIVMPGVNGIALARMARIRNPRVRVILVTGYDLPGIDRQAFGPMLRKPLSDDLLLATIVSELSAKEAGSASA